MDSEALKVYPPLLTGADNVSALRSLDPLIPKIKAHEPEGKKKRNLKTESRKVGKLNGGGGKTGEQRTGVL